MHFIHHAVSGWKDLMVGVIGGKRLPLMGAVPLPPVAPVPVAYIRESVYIFCV